MIIEKISRKELAALISDKRGEDVTVFMVMSNEKKWGLVESRGKDMNKRVIRYDKKKAVEALAERGIIFIK